MYMAFSGKQIHEALSRLNPTLD